MNSHKMTSQKPYIIRALAAWINDNQMTPHLVVDVTRNNVKVPLQYAKDGQIILNISGSAALRLEITNKNITFQARFGGTLENIWIPITAVMGIYARETNMGMFFDQSLEENDDDDNGGNNDDFPPPTSPSGFPAGKPKLTLVKS